VVQVQHAAGEWQQIGRLHSGEMSTVQRVLSRGTRRSERILQAIADEFLDRRLAAGLSQAAIATACGISRSVYSRLETAKRRNLSIEEAAKVASVLGLDLSVRLYPGGEPLRDAAQHAKLTRIVAAVRPPLAVRLEVPLPASLDRAEQRSWDAVLFGRHARTAIEVEMRIRDAQALERRIALKRRDDPTDAFLLIVADTRSNRRVFAASPGLFADLPRLRFRHVIAALTAGEHPPTGLILA